MTLADPRIPATAAGGAAPTRGQDDFSPLVEGPLYWLYLWSGLCRRPLLRAHRRAGILMIVGWMPLFVLTALAGTLVGDRVPKPFLLDVEVQVRLLLVLPLLIVAEVFAHEVLGAALQQFRTRGLIPAADSARFADIASSAKRLARSKLAEAALVVTAILLAGVVRRSFIALDETTWHSVAGPAGGRLTLAGWWYSWVSLPFCQFLVVRWAYRFVIWIRLLWQVSRLRLELAAGHPDRAAGLGFLAETVMAFTPLVTAAGIQTTGVLMNRIRYRGAELADFKLEIGAIVIGSILLVLAPHAAFATQLFRAKRAALLDYGSFGSRQTRAFERRWVKQASTEPPAQASETRTPEEMAALASDVEAVANFAASYEAVRTMRSMPFGRDIVILVALSVAAPLAPLVLTVVPLAEILQRVVKIVL